jgi:S1-C subfamily serine protease
VQLAGGERLATRIVGTDAHADIAVLRVLDPLPLGVRPLRLAADRGVAVGDPVVAIGTPLGESQSLSAGTISGLGRSLPGLAGFRIDGAIQTDAAITLGDVVGVNVQIKSVGGGGEGLGFAIPAATVQRSVRQQLAHGRARYAYLGVRSRPVYPALADFLDLPVGSGVLVTAVRDRSPADHAGLRAGDRDVTFRGSRLRAGGDLIVATDGRPLGPGDRLAERLVERRPGARVRLTLYRAGRRQTLDVVLGDRPLLWSEAASGY